MHVRQVNLSSYYIYVYCYFPSLVTSATHVWPQPQPDETFKRQGKLREHTGIGHFNARNQDTCN